MWKKLILVMCCIGMAVILTGFSDSQVDLRDARDTGGSGLWILANISYAGMRAQNHQSTGWRIASFILGFPGTFLSWLCVQEVSDRAYGVQIPRRIP
jgi:hypothetical protein